MGSSLSPLLGVFYLRELDMRFNIPGGVLCAVYGRYCNHDKIKMEVLDFGVRNADKNPNSKIQNPNYRKDLNF